MRRPWIIWMLTLCASSAAADSFMPRALSPEHGVDVLTRDEAVRLMGRQLLSEPAGSAVYGTVHIYDQFPFVESQWVAVTSDARWRRLLYGRPGEAPRAFDLADAGGFGEPRGLAFAPDGRLFVSDRSRGRLHVLKLVMDGTEPRLLALDGIDGLEQPMDVAVDDGGTPADPLDDRVAVVEAGAHRLSLFSIAGDRPVRLSQFGSPGPGRGEFLSPRAVAIARDAGGNGTAVFVTDSGNHRLVRLQLLQDGLAWQETLDLPMEATSVDADPQGNLLLTLRRQNQVWKVSPQLEILARFGGGARALEGPRDVAVPFAWVHDHRHGEQAPAWRGEGSALVLEAWKERSGVRLVDLGVEIGALQRLGATQLEVHLTDAAFTTAEIVAADGRTLRHELGTLPAGTQTLTLPGLQEAQSVRIEAVSLYDPARRDAKQLVLATSLPRQVSLHQNVPNPFNPATTIAFDLPRAAAAILDVFDVKGRRVRRVFAGRLDAGPHAVVWDGRDGEGQSLPSGVYFYRLQALDDTQVRKMVMAR